MDNSSRNIILIVVLTLVVLVSLSFVPWSKLTDNEIKDYNLFEDLMPEPEPEPIPGFVTDVPEEAAVEIVVDSVATDTIAEEAPIAIAETAPMRDGVVMIENYTGDAQAFSKFRTALAESGSRLVRIAVAGDSYIEGDIFCQDLREIMQQRYGGSGVGFVPLHSEFPGFRRSVRQSSSGWILRDIRNFTRRDSVRNITSTYTRVDSGAIATTTFKGTSDFPHASTWQQSRFLYLASDSGSIRMQLADGTVRDFPVTPSPRVQAVSLPGATKSLTISTSVPSLVGLGAYLDGISGVQVDGMAVRGNSGLGLSSMNGAICAGMSRWVDYDLIILEFGMNAISAGRTEYEGYRTAFQRSIESVRRFYPNADILVMGIGDRGEKDGTIVKSMPTVAVMTKAQRRAARDAKVLFWDTRAAMGGDGAVAEWRKRKLVNADYVHINYQGGAEMAKLLDMAIQMSLNE